MNRTHASNRTSEDPIHDEESLHPQGFGSNTARMEQLKNNFSMIVQGTLNQAKEEAHRIAQEGRQEQDDDASKWAGWIWQTSHALIETQEGLGSEEWGTVQSKAHHAAEKTRALDRDGVVDARDAASIEAAAGGYWQQADQAMKQLRSSEQDLGSAKGDVGPYAVWTTGGGSSLLPRDNWDASDLRPHHSDRTNSAAANRVRASSTPVAYNSVDAFDLTFEKMDSNGNAMNGSAQGLPLMVPVRSLVVDIQKTFQGSGGYGKFILIEYLEGDLVGQRVEIHHLDTVEDVRKGEELPAGAIFGTQGASGTTRFGYATHVDIVGTADAVVLFAKSNQTGNIQTKKEASVNVDSAPQEETKSTQTPSIQAVRAGGGMLKQGMEGAAVAHVQKLLKIASDGIFGPQTKRAVEAFQRNAKLTPPPGLEGVVGKTTLSHLEKPKSAIDLQAPGAMGIAPLAISGTEMQEQFTPQLIAFARAITYAEGTGDAAGYFREVGSKDYGSQQNVHPGAENVYRHMETGYNSDAFGRYQTLSSTWASWARQADIPTVKPGTNNYGEAYYNMAPEFQDKAMLSYLVRQGVQDVLISGRVERAVGLVNRTWSSLPGGSQRNDKTAQFYTVYNKMLSEELSRS